MNPRARLQALPPPRRMLISLGTRQSPDSAMVVPKRVGLWQADVTAFLHAVAEVTSKADRAGLSAGG